jgi:hypothetical protein
MTLTSSSVVLVAASIIAILGGRAESAGAPHRGYIAAVTCTHTGANPALNLPTTTGSAGSCGTGANDPHRKCDKKVEWQPIPQTCGPATNTCCLSITVSAFKCEWSCKRGTVPESTCVCCRGEQESGAPGTAYVTVFCDSNQLCGAAPASLDNCSKRDDACPKNSSDC